MYLCPKCNSEMFCISTASIPPITHYECYYCGYTSKSVQENNAKEVLPKDLQQPQVEDKWIALSEGRLGCPVCGEEISIDKKYYKFCPNCGNSMDGVHVAYI